MSDTINTVGQEDFRRIISASLKENTSLSSEEIHALTEVTIALEKQRPNPIITCK